MSPRGGTGGDPAGGHTVRMLYLSPWPPHSPSHTHLSCPSCSEEGVKAECWPCLYLWETRVYKPGLVRASSFSPWVPGSWKGTWPGCCGLLPGVRGEYDIPGPLSVCHLPVTLKKGDRVCAPGQGLPWEVYLT